MSFPPRQLFERIYRRHGHRCPMSTLGGRIGWAARTALQDSADARGIYFIRTCAVDGIREAAGLQEGEGGLRVEDRGEHRMRMIAAGEGVEVVLLPEALAIAGRYRQLSESLDRERKHLAKEELGEREADLEQVLQGVLEELWSLPDLSLLRVRPLTPGEIYDA